MGGEKEAAGLTYCIVGGWLAWGWGLCVHAGWPAK